MASSIKNTDPPKSEQSPEFEDPRDGFLRQAASTPYLSSLGLLGLYRSAKDAVNNRIYNGITPYGYYGSIPRMLYPLTGGKSWDRDTYGTPEIRKIRNDAWSIYLDRDQPNQSLTKADYKPTKGVNLYNRLFGDFYKPHDKNWESSIKNTVGASALTGNRLNTFDPRAMGNFSWSIGEDDKGKYLAYYDKWDLAPVPAGLGPGEPFYVYDRLYEKDIKKQLKRHGADTSSVDMERIWNNLDQGVTKAREHLSKKTNPVSEGQVMKQPENQAFLETIRERVSSGVEQVGNRLSQVRNRLSDFFKQDGGDVSRLGYSDGSPYRTAPFLDINSNNITMENTGVTLIAIPNVGPARVLPPYSGSYQFPGADFVREIPLTQDGGPIDPGTRAQAELLWRRNSALPFIQRWNDPNQPSIPNPTGGPGISTHLMAHDFDENGDWWVYPKIQEIDGELKYPISLEEAKQKGNAFRAPKKIAEDISKNYKNFQDGGPIPKAQDGFLSDWFQRGIDKRHAKIRNKNEEILRSTIMPKASDEEINKALDLLSQYPDLTVKSNKSPWWMIDHKRTARYNPGILSTESVKVDNLPELIHELGHAEQFKRDYWGNMGHFIKDAVTAPFTGGYSETYKRKGDFEHDAHTNKAWELAKEYYGGEENIPNSFLRLGKVGHNRTHSNYKDGGVVPHYQDGDEIKVGGEDGYYVSEEAARDWWNELKAYANEWGEEELFEKDPGKYKWFKDNAHLGLSPEENFAKWGFGAITGPLQAVQSAPMEGARYLLGKNTNPKKSFGVYAGGDWDDQTTPGEYIQNPILGTIADFIDPSVVLGVGLGSKLGRVGGRTLGRRMARAGSQSVEPVSVFSDVTPTRSFDDLMSKIDDKVTVEGEIKKGRDFIKGLESNPEYQRRVKALEGNMADTDLAPYDIQPHLSGSASSTTLGQAFPKAPGKKPTIDDLPFDLVDEVLENSPSEAAADKILNNIINNISKQSGNVEFKEGLAKELYASLSAHEYSHIQDRGGKAFGKLGKNTLIDKIDELIGPHAKNDAIKGPIQRKDRYDYVREPTEVRSRINELRFAGSDGDPRKAYELGTLSQALSKAQSNPKLAGTVRDLLLAVNPYDPTFNLQNIAKINDLHKALPAVGGLYGLSQLDPDQLTQRAEVEPGMSYYQDGGIVEGEYELDLTQDEIDALDALGYEVEIL